MPTEEEEIYPYRRIWRSLAIESLILLLVAVGLWVLVSFIGISLPSVIERPAEIALCILPFGLWALLSLLQERTVPEPRSHLLALVAITALAANAVAIPVIDSVLQVELWLPMAPALNRIAGYMFTVGIIQVLTCYTVFRFVAYSTGMRIRADGIAYMLASAVGYGCVLNLHYVFTTNASIDIVAMRIFNNISLLYAVSVVVGYGIGEVRFGRPSPLLLTLTMAIGAMLAGIAIPVRSGLINAALTLGPALASPIRGLALSALLLVAVCVVTAFLMENAERRESDAHAARD